ncbi:Predicted arabinose efflux permease, MFS family [Propionibacterium cyclohexanicum]|uniref:Predicted arabinose efflux permease, MFS family n=1 Tax=Propionibacterium cyclohexanicum TaxID=64702 RepID=A0A1H9RGJ7_9ACTN|nr:MFS transporter [Propionibacterium cyclohexanicum]SER71113.1 Predicted arabinose efflux permease, MFS family [Propionibacterium cyclohexanicum]
MSATTATGTIRALSSGSRTFASFAQRNYRYYFAGALVSNTGTWMQRTSQDWLVLTQLTNHSTSALGIVSALQFLAMPFLAPLAGAVTDRFPKRKLLLVTQTLLGLTTLMLWALVASGTVELWHVYLFAFVQGIVASFDNPARQAFVSEMVPDALISNAVGLNSMSFNAARLIGPGIAGLLIAAFGVAPGMLINTVSFLAMILALVSMNAHHLHPAAPRRGRGSAREGLAYIAHRPDLIMVMVMVFMLGTFGINYQITNAAMATRVFHRGPAGYGMLGTIMSVGTLAAALIAARRRRPRLSTLVIGMTGFTLSTIASALAPSYLSFAILLIPAGLFGIVTMTCANSMVQMGTEASKRGRVMAVYMAIVMGGTPVGAPIIGWVGDVLGPRQMVLVGPLATGLTTLGVLGFLMVHRGLRVRLERGWPPHLHVWTSEELEAAQQSAEPGR